MLKTSLIKIIFVAAVLGVLALTAIAPPIARAFFPEGVAGFAGRFFGSEAENIASPSALDANVLAADQMEAAGAALEADGQVKNNLEQVKSSLEQAAADVLSNGSPAETYFEFIGTLTAMEGDVWTVDGVAVYVTAMTELKGALEIDILVKVEGELQEDGSVLAREIKPALFDEGSTGDGNSDDSSSQGEQNSESGKIEFSGTLTEQSDNLWVVNGISVHLDEMTEVNGAPVVGDLIKVEGMLQEDSSVLAREIKPVVSDDDPATDGNKIEFTGTLAEQTDSLWVVNGISVLITEITEVYGTPVAGDLVKVEGMLQEDGSVLAREIKPADFGDDGSDDNSDDGHDGEFEFKGILEAQNGNTWIVEGMTVLITDQTEIKGTLAVGDLVKVHGMKQDDGSILASKIESAQDDDSSSRTNRGNVDDSDDDHNGDDDHSGNNHHNDGHQDDDHDDDHGDYGNHNSDDDHGGHDDD